MVELPVWQGAALDYGAEGGMVNMRNYGAGVVTAMVSMAQGGCYWPDCGEPILRFVDGVPVNNFEIAHIRAASPNGPRYDESMTEEERNEFSNLLLLCTVHHKVVDKLRPNDFSVERLQDWKLTRETAGQAALRGLRDLTEDRLLELITESLQVFRAEIDDALARLESVDLKAANLLRPLVNELAEARLHVRFPDEDTAAMLNESARRLGHLEDTAPMLAGAARDLTGLQETAELLVASAREFKQARQFM